MPWAEEKREVINGREVKVIKMEPKTDSYSQWVYWISTFCIAHYVVEFIFPIFAFVIAFSCFSYWGWTKSILILISTTCLYLGSYFFHFPHYTRTWRMPWFTYSKFWDDVISYSSNFEYIVEELEPNDKPKIMVMAPHGLLGVCRICIYGTKFPEIYPNHFFRWAAATPQFNVPVCREICLAAGAIDASKKNLIECLTDGSGDSVAILPGGTKELMLTDPRSDTTKLVWLTRKGFARLAVDLGVDIIPCFVFGEKFMHDFISLPQFIREFLYKYKLPGRAPIGRYFTLMPKTDRAYGCVFGKTISVKQTKGAEAPAEVDKLHQHCMDEIQRIFDVYKKRFGYDDEEKLEFVSSKMKL